MKNKNIRNFKVKSNLKLDRGDAVHIKNGELEKMTKPTNKPKWIKWIKELDKLDSVPIGVDMGGAQLKVSIDEVIEYNYLGKRATANFINSLLKEVISDMPIRHCEPSSVIHKICRWCGQDIQGDYYESEFLYRNKLKSKWTY